MIVLYFNQFSSVGRSVCSCRMVSGQIYNSWETGCKVQLVWLAFFPPYINCQQRQHKNKKTKKKRAYIISAIHIALIHSYVSQQTRLSETNTTNTKSIAHVKLPSFHLACFFFSFKAYNRTEEKCLHLHLSWRRGQRGKGVACGSDS